MSHGLPARGFVPWAFGERWSIGVLHQGFEKGDVVYKLFALLFDVVVAVAGLSIVPRSADATTPGAVGRIVFVSTSDDPFGEIYTRDFGGGTWQRLTSSPTAESTPA